jgi:DNA-binding GntR family transcriptional regulator
MVLCWLINTLVDATASLLEDRRLWCVEPEYVNRLQAVCDAVLAHDAEAAAAALKEHFCAADAAFAERLADFPGGTP